MTYRVRILHFLRVERSINDKVPIVRYDRSRLHLRKAELSVWRTYMMEVLQNFGICERCDFNRDPLSILCIPP